MRRSIQSSFVVVLVAATAAGALSAPFAARERAEGQSPTPAPVRVWQDTVMIPTYEEGLPDPNPPFDLFQQGSFLNYPYTLRHNLTDRRIEKRWRALWVENEFLKCLVLPDLGGHLYGCTDKRNGQEMFYANPSIKPARIAYRGTWAAFGIEFNFPVSHNWMTMSPVDFATTTGEDGSASVWVGNVDRPYGMQWRVQLTLRPGRAVLEQHTTLYNQADTRHRFYWWTNAGVQVWDDTRILYPMEYTASHGFTFIDTWPIDAAGHDLSLVGNHKYGPVSRFSHGSREPYMAVYHPKTKSGVVHYSSPTDLPSKKVWSWSSDADGLDWRRALSDNDSAYVEIQAGLFRNQETYGFLEPEQAIHFSEYWVPMLDLGGLTRANTDVLLSLARTNEKPGLAALDLAINVTRPMPGATLSIADGVRQAVREQADLSAAATFRRRYPGQLSAGVYTVTVTDADGVEVMRHTEGTYDFAGRGTPRGGPQSAPRVVPPSKRTDGDYLEMGTDQEMNGRYLGALSTYQEGLARYPESLGLARAAGRLMVVLKQYEAAVPLLTRALSRVSHDREMAYYLGLAQQFLGRMQQARLAWESTQQYGPHRPAALYQLAATAARAGSHTEALALLGEAAAGGADMVRAWAMQAALLRQAGRRDDAARRLAVWRRIDPTSVALRYEAVKSGGSDEALWAHLAADPERILELVTEYMRFGLDGDALQLLSRSYPSGPDVVSEPGSPRPESYPLLAYFRGFVTYRTGGDGAAHYQAASAMPTTYVFPHRPETLAVLNDVVTRDPRDATAWFLLGSVRLSGGMVEAAMRAWEEARALRPGIPTLHRNMGYAQLAAGKIEEAIALFEEGTRHDGGNIGVYTGLEEALSRASRPAADRARALLSYPDQRSLPAALVYKLALALAEDGRFDAAEQQFQGRFFPRQEGGINVRQIWLEVRARRAAARASAGDCRQALDIVARLTAPVPGLVFTNDGLEPFLTRPALADLVGRTRTSCGAAPAVADADVRYGIGSWDAETFGNHRVVLRVTAAAPAVLASMPWRRWDQQPERTHLVVVEGRTGGQVLNVARLSITRERGDIAFEAPSAGDYYVYYLPNVMSGRVNYPTVTYPPPENTADRDWLEAHGLTEAARASEGWQRLPSATVVEMQAVEPLHSFFPMQVIATRDEVAALLEQHPSAPFLVFPEDRTNPIKMPADLPLRWVRRGANGPVIGEALRGEFYAFQLGVFAARQDLQDVTVRFGDLSRGGGGSIPASAFRCFNLGGVDPAARPFTRRVDVKKGAVQALWCGMQVAESARAGEYAGRLTLAAQGLPPTDVPVRIRVGRATIAAHGDDEPWRLSRLRWLDSTLAVDDDVVKPYTPVVVAGRTVSVLGRSVTLDDLGFPSRIESRFAVEMTHLVDAPRQVLSAPLAIVVRQAGGEAAAWTAGALTFTKRAPGAAAWKGSAASGALGLETSAQMDFDGNIEYTVRLSAREEANLDDVRLEIPVAADVARYLMGLGFKGGRRPASFEWKWDVKNNQDSAWIGDVNAGLQFTLKDDRYVRPLNTNFYTLKPLVMPASWHNGGQGGCRFEERDASTYLVSCFSGTRTLAKGEALFFNFRLLLTPFKPIDTKAQFSTRFFHAFKPVDDVVNTGATVVNVHHANPINPYINYPFFRPAEMKAYVDEAHRQGLRVKIYYTVRELANRAPEVFALRSLGDVFAPGPGGGYSWLQEHLGSDYIAAWFVPDLKDAAIVNSGVSRWHNFYVEGLDWLARTVGIDGLYIDDVAFDRLTMKRVRKVLDRHRPDALIDLHSANQYNVRDGFASSANLYLEHLPYLNRLWFGEYFDYDSQPDYWLTEISGIPFGLMGEMLEKGGNPWRGMLFGMTGRLPWSGDPRPLWKAWDEFGLADSRMIGFWVPDHPVQTGREDVLATAYVRDGRALIAVAGWTREPVDVTLTIDWKALGLDPRSVTLTAPGITGFQEGRSFAASGPIPIEPGRGWLLVVK